MREGVPAHAFSGSGEQITNWFASLRVMFALSEDGHGFSRRWVADGAMEDPARCLSVYLTDSVLLRII